MSLSQNQIQQQLQELQGWTLETSPQSIDKALTFDTFDAAVRFFNQVAQLANAHDHHPEVWSSYTRLRIRLWTHDAGGLTDKDFALARAIDLLGPAT